MCEFIRSDKNHSHSQSHISNNVTQLPQEKCRMPGDPEGSLGSACLGQLSGSSPQW